MLDAHVIINLFDVLAQINVDNQLSLIAAEDPDKAITTERTVYARDPLRSISDDLDQLKLVPTYPASGKFQVISGRFYDRGVMYIFGGAEYEIKDLPRAAEVFLYVGILVDRMRHLTELYVSEDYGTLTEFHPGTVPVGVVRLRPNSETILSTDIVNLLPLYNYDTDHPADKMQAYIPCLPPNGSIILDRRPFYRTKLPIIDIWQTFGGTLATVTSHVFESKDDAIDLLNPDNSGIDYDDDRKGISIGKEETIEYAPMPVGPHVIYISASRGVDIYDGTFHEPVASFGRAAEIFNSDPIYTTIFVEPGIYTPTSTVIFTRSVTIQGSDTLSVRIVFKYGFIGFDFQGSPATWKNVTFLQEEVLPIPYTGVCMTAGYLLFYNCLFRNEPSYLQYPWIHTINVAFFNCIMHNLDKTYPAIMWMTLPTGSIAMWNNIIIGTWSNLFMIGGGSSNWWVSEANFGIWIMDPVHWDYRIIKNSPLDGGGTSDGGIGQDLDGSNPDLGIYGGGHASKVPVPRFPTKQPSVFRFAHGTLFTPVMERILNITAVIEVPSGTKVFAAVTFNGGGNWLRWNSEYAAWQQVDLRNLQITGNTFEELRTALVEYGAIVPQGEFAIAWGFYTEDPKVSPILKSFDVHFKVHPESYVPFDRTQVQLYVNNFAILVHNKTNREIKSLQVVAY